MVLEVEQVGAQQNGAGALRNGTGPKGVEPWRWTVGLYEKAAEQGFFEGQRVELIHGEIIAMMPMGPLHIGSTTNLSYTLIRKLPDSLRVLVQIPLTLGEANQPEPDISIVDAEVIRNRQAPTTAHLVAEVSSTTLQSDRTTKASLYASAQIAEYWIVNVNARTLEVLREPIEDEDELSGWRYGHTQVLREDATLAPLCAPEVEFTVREMLP